MSLRFFLSDCVLFGVVFYYYTSLGLRYSYDTYFDRVFGMVISSLFEFLTESYFGTTGGLAANFGSSGCGFAAIFGSSGIGTGIESILSSTIFGIATEFYYF